MITEVKPLCAECLNINEIPYVKIQNISSLYISFILKYTEDSTIITKQSAVFGPGETEQLTFTPNSSNISFKVVNNYYYPPTLICCKYIDSASQVFYKVVNDLGILKCIQVGLGNSMISNITPCCRKCFNPNNNFYLKITNNYANYVYINLEYNIGPRTIKKQSPVFAPGKSEYLTFSPDTSKILFRVFDVSQMPPEIIWMEFSRYIKSTCYNLTGNSSDTANCIEVPC